MITLTKIITISQTSLVTVESSLTIGCEAGSHVQGGMRQLASDRWNYMYPSN